MNPPSSLHIVSPGSVQGGTRQATRHGSLEYRPAIDGLRALAILSVFVFHLEQKWLPGGFVGVDVFFVISGFLITSIIYKDLHAGRFSLAQFYQRRVARIFPAFFLVGLGTLVAAAFVYSPQHFAWAGRKLIWAALSGANVQYMLQGDYFEASPDSQPYLHYWSLSVEEQFYMIFPLLLAALFKRRSRRILAWLGCLVFASLVLSIVMTRMKPVWAFFLLPTRAWELGAGCLLAVACNQRGFSSAASKFSNPISASGLILVISSFFLVPESGFPGLWALLPVLGSVALLIPTGPTAIGERVLGNGVLVWIGRISYSLYLWHWPVFSLVDYSMLDASGSARMGCKVGISVLGATLSFLIVENPARSLLNRKTSRAVAYGFLLLGLASSVIVGNEISRRFYVNASAADVAKGGLVFEAKSHAPSMVLLGDSNAAMYGKMAQEMCEDLGYNLTVLGVAGGDPLPTADEASGPLWLDSLAVIRRDKPDYLVLACLWTSRLKANPDRLAQAVETLKPLVGRLVILDQPPFQPEYSTRADLRSGAKGPFHERADDRRRRLEVNQYLGRFNAGNCEVLEVSALFEGPNSEVPIFDAAGREIFGDHAHLSGWGVEIVRPYLERVLVRPQEPQRNP